MRLTKVLLASVALSVTATPVLAAAKPAVQAVSQRAGAPVAKSEKALGGGVIVAVLAAAAVIAGIIIVADDDDDDDSN